MTKSGFYEIILFGFGEFQGCSVHAVTESGRFWTVIENVSEVSAAGAANDFGAGHAMRFIYDLFHMGGFNRPEKAWPAGSRVVLGVRAEQWGSACRAGIGAFFLVVIIRMRKRSFCAFFKQNETLLPGELLLPFFLGFLNFSHVIVF